jgi:glycosyltransferase involved in cell wall biosynthesis
MPRPLRFCHLTTFYPPHNFGGDGIGIQRLCRALARRGHHVHVVYDRDAYRKLSGGKDPELTPDPDGIEITALSSPLGTASLVLTQQLGRPVAHAAAIRKILAEGQYDVINFHNASLVGGPGLFAYGDAVKLYMAHEHWLVCASHVLWRHGRELCKSRQCLRCVLNHGRPPQAWRYAGVLARQGKHIDTFIAMSEFSRSKHREYGFPFDMEVLPYFLPDPEPAASSSNEATTSPHARPYFLFVGRLEIIKGLQEVIPLFAERYTQADLLIAGDGEYMATLEALAGDNQRVKFLGRVPLDDLNRYYRHALSLIVPSMCYETFGIILIEAFRQHTPVIARRIGPLPEIVEQARAGVLFETPDELLAALHSMQNDAVQRAKWADNGEQAYREHYCESRVLPRYLDIVRRAAQRKHDRRVLSALGESPVNEQENA